MSEMQLSGNGCTACLGKRKHRRNGENQGFFNHRADSLLACSCYIPRAGWKVTRCFQGWLPTGERCVEVSRLHAAVPHLLGLKAPRGGSGAAQGLLSVAAAGGVHNRALLQHSAPCLCAAAPAWLPAAMALSEVMDTG